MIKETHMPIRKADKNNSSLSGSILEIPRIFKKDRRFLFYMLSLTFLNGIYFALPFLSVHALKVLDKPGSFLGALVLAMICGQFISNFICGYLGDRYGGKLGFSITFILYLLAFTISAFATSSWLFLLIFFILGFCKDSTFVCRATLNAEIPPLERRVKYQSVINLILLPGIIVIPLCGSFLWNDGKGIAPVCALSVLSIAIGLFFLRKVREPRFS
jgi:predicted MFS family arabinose efflux permease